MLVVEDQTTVGDATHSDGDVFMLDDLRELPHLREVMKDVKQMLDCRT